MPPNSVGKLSSLAAIRELTAAVENRLVWWPPSINKRRAHNVVFKRTVDAVARREGQRSPQISAVISEVA